MAIDDVVQSELPEAIAAELERVQIGEYKGIVIYPPTIDWGTLHQRPQQITKHFARAGYLVFYCTPNHDRVETEGYTKLEEGLYLTDQLEQLVGIKDPIVIVTWPNHEPLIHRFTGNPTLVYEVIDELSLFGGDDNPDVVLWDQNLTRIADVVTATANRLLEHKRTERPDTVLVENGADIEHFLREVSEDEIPLEIRRVKELGRPIVGYYGALADWFDYDLFFEAARRRPDLSFVLIGRDYHNNGFLQEKLSHAPPNVFYIGGEGNKGVPYETLPGYLRAFDVATIPFDSRSPVIQSTSPVKLFEYMAGGVPVVTTDFPEARKYSVVLRARTCDEFLLQVDEALRLRHDPEFRKRLVDTARENSWEERVSRIEAAIHRAHSIGPHRLEMYRTERRCIDALIETANSVASKNPEEAVEIYKRILTLNPDQPLIELELGKVLLYRLHDPSRAIPHLERVVKILKGSGWAHNYLGEAYLRNGNYGEGERTLERALQIPDYNGSQANARSLLQNHRQRLTLHYEAEVLSRYGHQEQALEVYKKILQLSEDDRLADFEIGKIYLQKRDYDNAIIHFRRTTTLVPDSPWSHMYLGMALLETGQRQEARTSFNEALKCTGTDMNLKQNIESLMIRCQ